MITIKIIKRRAQGISSAKAAGVAISRSPPNDSATLQSKDKTHYFRDVYCLKSELKEKWACLTTQSGTKIRGV